MFVLMCKMCWFLYQDIVLVFGRFICGEKDLAIVIIRECCRVYQYVYMVSSVPSTSCQQAAASH